MKKPLAIGLIIAISATIFLYYVHFQQPSQPSDTPIQQTEETKTQKDSQPPPQSNTIEYSPNPTEKLTGSKNQMIEGIINLKGQFVYYAYPETVDKSKPPQIIIYSHGSTDTVSKTNTQFIQNLHLYADLFTQHNFVFVAPNEHGQNWGNSQAIQDIEDAIEFIRSKVYTQDRVMLIGFSMGGLPTINYAFKHPKQISKIALLAGTTYAYRYTKVQYQSIKNIDIQIWHGDKDVNVPLQLSRNFVAVANRYGTEIKLKVINGEDHWDMDPGKRQEVLEFFED